jgi:hypothetical protein
MGTIFRYRDVRIVIRTKDHNPPHVHVVRGDAEAKIEILSQKVVLSSGFTRNDLKRIATFLAEQKDKLFEAWEAIHNEEE